MTRPNQRYSRRWSWRVLFSAMLAVLIIGLGGSANGTVSAFSATTAESSTMAAKTALTCSTAYANQVKSSNGIANYWQLNDTSGTTAAATTGGTSGTYVNTPTLNNSKPRVSMTNSAALFNGTNQYVNTADIDDFTGTASYTVEAWVRRTAARTTYDVIAAKETTTPARSGWLMYVWPASGGYKLGAERWNGAGGNDGVSGTTKLELNRWYHVAMTYTSTALSIYVDGELDATTAPTVSLVNTTAPLTIAASGGAAPYSWLQGNVGQVAVYSRALTAQELKDHYDSCTYSAVVRSDSPTGYWPLDEPSGTSAADTATANLTGTYSRTPALAQASAFPTDNSTTKNSVAFTRASNQSVDFTLVPVPGVGTAAFSVDMWVKPTATPTDFNRLYSAEWTVSGKRVGWSVFTMATGAPRCNRIDSAGTEDKTTANLTLPLNSWSHIACTYDGSTIKMYVNGALSNSVASTRAIPAVTGSSYSRINGLSGQAGVYNAVVTDYWTGNIDDVAVYNTALTATQVQNHYNAQ